MSWSRSAAIALLTVAAVTGGVASATSSTLPPSRIFDLAPLGQVELRSMPPVDVEALLAEDAARGKDLPLRIGFPMKADLAPDRAGTWETLPDGSRVWRLRVRSAGAMWIVLGFGTYRLAPGAAMWVYDAGGGQVLGPFTAADVRSHGQLWFPPLEGDTAVVELHWPKALADTDPNLHLGTVSHGYKPWGAFGRPDEPSPDAGSCNIDVNCPLGDAWQDEKRGVVNLLDGGSGYCSGSVIANADSDCTPYVLTAAHCLSSNGAAASTTFQFNFERPACNSGTAPTDQTVTGSTLKATYSASDFTLLLMDVEPPSAYQAYYNGWSRSTTPASQSWCIHHPNNDEKSISRNLDPLIDGSNWGPDHWRVTEWEDGTTEPGSSGSPLFDQNHRIVGQLHGGTASCTSLTYDEFGKFDVSWNGGGTAASRLKDWLDPSGTGVVTQDGYDATVCGTPRPKLVYAGHVANDTPGGNGDGVVDPGETIELQVDESNTGTLDATSVAGTLTTTTTGVSITDDTASFPDIPQGQTRRSDPPHFTLVVPGDHPCGQPIALTIHMSAVEDPGSWTSDFEVPTGTPQTDTLFQDDMESGVGGWTQQTLSGNNPWGQTTTDAASPTTSWFVSNIDTVSDSVLLMTQLTALPDNARMIFQHRINSESGYDGGVLEYSTDGATWLDAGALIVRGGYTNTISSSYSSPLGGREAWSGDSGGWQEVEVDLSTLAGSDVRFRWRFATDSSVSDEGWYIDDVVVDATSYICNPAGPALPGEVSDPAGGGALLTVAKHPDGFELKWSAPPDGGPVDVYKLYRSALGGPLTAVCEADLGTGLSIVLPTLSDQSEFVAVARNASGEGSYGKDSGGNPRSKAKSGDACP